MWLIGVLAGLIAVGFLCDAANRAYSVGYVSALAKASLGAALVFGLLSLGIWFGIVKGWL